MRELRPVPESALTLIRAYEGLRLHAYRDPVGIWTIGYGHTGPVNGAKIRAGMEIDRATAEALLLADAQLFGNRIWEAAKPDLTDGQYGALVSFAFNLGWNALRGSTLWRLVQANDLRAASAQFGRWTKAGRPRRVLPGLVKRRAAERALFDGAP
jgi:GH24 family phage-related lysozyme (muramidase)